MNVLSAKQVDDNVVNKVAQDVLKEVLVSQAFYAEKFIQTATYLDSKSFYVDMAKFIDLKNERVVLDIGCGDCRLIRELYVVRPNVTIVGVDINPLLLMAGEKMLEKLGYNVNIHTGVNIAMDPVTKVLTLISDLLYDKKTTYVFKGAMINLIQEDIRFAEITRRRDLGFDIITYSLSGGFSPHIELERDNKDSSIVKAGIELNNNIMGLGVELLHPGGRMIWAQRAAAKNTESLRTMNLDDLGLSIFKPYYDVNKVKVINIDENKAGLGLTLPAFVTAMPTDKTVYYSGDVRKMDNYDFQGVILLIEMIRTSATISRI